MRTAWGTYAELKFQTSKQGSEQGSIAIQQQPPSTASCVRLQGETNAGRPIMRCSH